MRARATPMMAAILLAGCGDSAGPAASSFTAAISGARTLTLSGDANGGTIFTEDHPGPQFAIRMFDERGDTVLAVSIVCPGDEPAPGQHAIGAGADECGATYARTVTAEPSIGGSLILENADASAGRVTIGSVAGNQAEGSFSFTGPLLAGIDSIGGISAAGSFSAQVP